jgi:hypothetical protein
MFIRVKYSKTMNENVDESVVRQVVTSDGDGMNNATFLRSNLVMYSGP